MRSMGVLLLSINDPLNLLLAKRAVSTRATGMGSKEPWKSGNAPKKAPATSACRTGPVQVSVSPVPVFSTETVKMPANTFARTMM